MTHEKIKKQHKMNITSLLNTTIKEEDYFLKYFINDTKEMAENEEEMDENEEMEDEIDENEEMDEITILHKIYGKYYKNGEYNINITHLGEHLHDKKEYDALYNNRTDVYLYALSLSSSYDPDSDDDEDDFEECELEILPYYKMVIMVPLHISRLENDLNRTNSFESIPGIIDPQEIFKLGMKNHEWYGAYREFINPKYTIDLLIRFSAMDKVGYKFGGIIPDKLSKVLFATEFEESIYKRTILPKFNGFQAIQLYRSALKNPNLVSHDFTNMADMMMRIAISYIGILWEYSFDEHGEIILSDESNGGLVWNKNLIDREPMEIRKYLIYLRHKVDLSESIQINQDDIKTDIHDFKYMQFSTFDLSFNYL